VQFSWISAIASLPKRISEFLFSYDIFISYAHNDGLLYASTMDKALRQTYTTHLDTRDFLAGQNLSLLTKVRVRRSRLLVVIARSHALDQSQWVLQEVEEYAATGREPIFVDVGQSLERSLQAPVPGRLSGWLSVRQGCTPGGTVVDSVLRIRDAAADTGPERIPAKEVADAVAARFTGDRIETRRLRIIKASIVVLALISIAAVIAAYNAINAATRARAEALASDALVAASGTFQSDGYLLDALDRVVRALDLDPTSGVLAAASRIESGVPDGLAYAPQIYHDIRDLTVRDGVAYMLEGNRVRAVAPHDLRPRETWEEQTIGVLFGQSLLPVPGGFITVGLRSAARVDPDGTQRIATGGRVSTSRPGGGFAVINATTAHVSLVSNDGIQQELSCDPDLHVAWVGFLSRDEIVYAGRSGSKDKLVIQNLADCSARTMSLPAQPMGGTVLRGARQIVIRTPQSVVAVDAALAQQQNFNVPNTSTITAVTRPQEGFAVGTQDGRVTLFQIGPGGRTMLAGEIDKVVPGTVTALAHDPRTNRLLVAGRIGFFVGAENGALASLPLAEHPQYGLMIATSRPMETVRIFEPSDRPFAFAGRPEGVLFASAAGDIAWNRWDGPVTISLSSRLKPKDGQVAAISAFGETVYVALNRKQDATVLGFDLSGNETFRQDVAWRIGRIEGFQNGVFALPSVPPGFFNFGSDPVVASLGLDGTETLFSVPNMNQNQGHTAVVADPTGRTILFVKFDGAEFRPATRYETPSECLARPDPLGPGNAIVSAAFAPDGDTVVLGTWDGLLSVWHREGICWALKSNLDTSPGRMIPTLAFDGTTVVGRSLSSPMLVRRWNARTGDEIGAAYQFEAWALSIAPRSPENTPAIVLPWSATARSTRIAYASPREHGVLDLSADAITARLCTFLANALSSGLIPQTPSQHPCTLIE
jgi:type II secretory pathway pseudopilin PulG